MIEMGVNYYVGHGKVGRVKLPAVPQVGTVVEVDGENYEVVIVYQYTDKQGNYKGMDIGVKRWGWGQNDPYGQNELYCRVPTVQCPNCKDVMHIDQNAGMCKCGKLWRYVTPHLQKEALLINAQFSWILEVDGKSISFQGFDNADYLEEHYTGLGYKVRREDRHNK